MILRAQNMYVPKGCFVSFTGDSVSKKNEGENPRFVGIFMVSFQWNIGIFLVTNIDFEGSNPLEK